MVCHVLKQNDKGTGMPSSLRSCLQLITKAQLDESSARDAVAKSPEHWTSLFIHILLFLKTPQSPQCALVLFRTPAGEMTSPTFILCLLVSPAAPSLYCSLSIFIFLLRHPVNLLYHVFLYTVFQLLWEVFQMQTSGWKGIIEEVLLFSVIKH